jgi:hypothetical protein
MESLIRQRPELRSASSDRSVVEKVFVAQRLCFPAPLLLGTEAETQTQRSYLLGLLLLFFSK